MKNLIKFLKANHIKVVRIIVIGNSVASGFSLSCKMKPLMFYNSDFVKNLENCGVKVEVNHFARPQDNNNKRILEWLYQDVTVCNIQNQALIDNNQMYHQFKREKYLNSNEEKARFYDHVPNQDKKISEIMQHEENVYHICILSCGTGAFLDSLTRNNIFPWKMLKCFKSYFRDLKYYEQILDYLYIQNPYLPVLVNPIHLIKPILPFVLYGNYLIRKRAKKHGNAYMIKPIYTKGFYSTPEHKNLYFDFHPCEEEYIKLCDNINLTIDETVWINHIKQHFYVIFRKFAASINQLGYIDQEIKPQNIQRVYEEAVEKLRNLNYPENLIRQGYQDFYKVYLKEYEFNFYRVRLKKLME